MILLRGLLIRCSKDFPLFQNKKLKSNNKEIRLITDYEVIWQLACKPTLTLQFSSTTKYDEAEKRKRRAKDGI